MDFTTIPAAYEGLKVGKTILTSLYESKIAAASKQKVAEALEKFGEAQDTLFAMREELFRLQTENESLKKQIAESESWEEKLSKYELVKTEGRAVVYRFKGEPEHYACPSCVATQKTIQILQDNRVASGEFRCIGCEGGFPINPSRSIRRGVIRN